MRETHTISQTAVSLAVKFLHERAILLKSDCKLPVSAEMAGTIADQIADEFALQTPQSPKQQVAKRTHTAREQSELINCLKQLGIIPKERQAVQPQADEKDEWDEVDSET